MMNKAWGYRSSVSETTRRGQSNGRYAEYVEIIVVQQNKKWPAIVTQVNNHKVDDSILHNIIPILLYTVSPDTNKGATG